ncbi:hypothetical protein AaE_001289 [Aphanomyces astaci]|uniref:Uncharacterized protein n=2 Tax=Aphanomyces astaci TaxID=112090 RepID=A0A6A5AIM0_APHAT|nr:hypothetical protein AaE_001289 [Aphanomyces astaci]
MAAVVAASSLPMVINDARAWEHLLTTTGEDVKTSALAMGNLIQLDVYAASYHCTSPRVERLYQVLQTHSPQLRVLSIDHGSHLEFSDEDDDAPKRAVEMQAIARGLFGPDSTLRLDRIKLMAPINERDLQHMIAVFDPQAPCAHVNRHRSMTLWGGEQSTIRGNTLAQLLQLIGGVECLELGGSSGEGVRTAEVGYLVRGCRSLRSLTVEATCAGWKRLTVAGKADSHLERLELPLGDRKSALIASGVERLLGHVGQSLVALSILSWRAATLKGKFA